MLHGEQSLQEMLEALEVAAYWDKRLYTRFPTTFNHTLSTGYFVTHSARMLPTGSIGFGVAYAPPYLNWNGRIQPFSHFELSANYRIFRGCPDSAIGSLGFGDYADRGANAKLALTTPEESFYGFPGVAVGVDDFMGSKKFTTYYVVGTQVIRDWGLEGSFGWGTGRYSKGPSRGFFGGINWFPLWECPNQWIQGAALCAEYDPTDYRNDPHPAARDPHTPINFGIKYTFKDIVEFSASRIRGDAYAVAGSLHYNWGCSEGILPKLNDPMLYTAPIDTEPLGCARPETLMIQQLNYALEEQGFQLTRAWLNGAGSQLRLLLINCRYRQEHLVRMRLQRLLALLAPSNLSEVVVVIESYGVPCQQYCYKRALLARFAAHDIGPFEFDLLTPRCEALPPSCDSQCIFQKRYELWRARIGPRFETFLGSTKGKFKYDLGLKGSIEGFLPFNWFYEIQASYTLLSTLHDLADFDFFHPSQLPNVATDYIRYRQQSTYTWDMLYLQKSWNWGCGFFGRVAGGYFQVNYAGLAAEVLWYPAHSCFAIGLEGAVVEKRSYSGLGFQTKLRHFEGKKPVFEPYFTLQQCFLDLYFDFPAYSLFSKVSLGRFLARDWGARLEVSRYFDNGLRLTGWMTWTNAHDVMHGDRYFDRGIALEIPFDLFYKCSSRRVWNYAMAAWLRDAGYAIVTGRPLFDTLNRERRW